LPGAKRQGNQSFASSAEASPLTIGDDQENGPVVSALWAGRSGGFLDTASAPAAPRRLGMTSISRMSDGPDPAGATVRSRDLSRTIPPAEGPAHQSPQTSAPRQKFILGVTGNIASGKSTVVNRLVEHGAIAFDADLVYREMVGPGQPLLATLADHFGEGIVAPDGTLDRAALGNIVFSDPEKLRELDRLTHPAVIAEIDRRVDAVEGGVVVIDAVKLVESGHADHCDSVWIVTIDTEVQVTRLMKRNRLSLLEARRRVEAQPPIGAKLARADRVIDNSGEIEDTIAQVDAGWREIMHRMGDHAD
jgi:dephospho-CoA kinase